MLEEEVRQTHTLNCNRCGGVVESSSAFPQPQCLEPKADELPLSSTTGFRQIGMTGLKPDEGRLLKDKEMVRAFEEAKLSPFANAYQERCVIARAQDAKTAPIIREETAREIFEEIERTAVKEKRDGTPWMAFDTGFWQALKKRQEVK